MAPCSCGHTGWAVTVRGLPTWVRSVSSAQAEHAATDHPAAEHGADAHVGKRGDEHQRSIVLDALDGLDGRIVDAVAAFGGRLKDADLGRVRRLQDESGGTISSLLARLGMVSERDIAEASAEVLDLPIIAARDCPDAPPAAQISIRFLKQHHVCPIGEDGETLDLLVADAQDPYPAEAVALATGALRGPPADWIALGNRRPDRALLRRCWPQRWKDVALIACREPVGRIRRRRGRCRAPARPRFGSASHPPGQPGDPARGRSARLGHPRRAVREPPQGALLRIDGVLEEVESPPANLTGAAVISRIKILAKLNIAERRLPQDGRIAAARAGQGARPAREHGADRARRVGGDAYPRSRVDRVRLPQAWLHRRIPAAVQEGARTAARDHARYRPYRFWQDHHAVHRAVAAQHRRR